jgi:eukaryotic-like serine/threonine-protein kinase
MPIAEVRLRQLRDLLTRAAIDGTSGVQFFLSELIGEGGQGWVYRAAYDEPDGPWVVVKLLRPDVVNEEALSRFLREADVLRKLGQSQAPCPSVVRFYDHGIFRYRMPDGEVYALPFTVLEYVPGATLAQLLDQANGKGLPVARVRRLFRQVARGLTVVHAAQIIHRDLKPSNLLVGIDGGQEVAKITDFGLVKRFDVDIKGTLALAGASIGYAPPEQFEMGNKRVSPRTDLFAFATVLYEALTGQAAFPLLPNESPFQVLSRVLSGPRPKLSDTLATLPPELAAREDLMAAIDREIERATRPDPGERHESVQAFWEAVEPLFRAATERGNSGTSKMPARDPGPLPHGPHGTAPGEPPGRPASAVPAGGGYQRRPSDAQFAAVRVVEAAQVRPSEPVLLAGAAPPSTHRAPEPMSLQGGVQAAALVSPVGPVAPGGAGPVRVLTTGQFPERAKALALTPDGRVGYALGRFGVRRWEAGTWSAVPLPQALDVAAARGLLATPAGEAVIFGERGSLWGVLPDGTGHPWAPADHDVTWTNAMLSLHPAEIVLLGEAASRPALGLLRPGQALVRSAIDAGSRLHASARLGSGARLLCGEGGVLLLTGSDGQIAVPWGRTGHLWAVVASADGGAYVVGSGGHALVVTPAGEAKLEPVQTTRDLHCVAVSPLGVAWAGGADARLVRRGPSGWMRVPLPAHLTATIGALQVGATAVLALLDDGSVVEAPAAW